MQRQEQNSHFSYILKSAQLKAINKKRIFHMYWATFFADKLKLHDHYRGLDLNQLTFCPIKASLPLKLNIVSGSPAKMKYSLTTSRSCFHKGQSKKMNSSSHAWLGKACCAYLFFSPQPWFNCNYDSSPEITISSIISTIIITAFF